MNRNGLSPKARRVLLGHRRCIAKNKSGGQCGKSAMDLQFVCSMHGGRSPLAKQHAEEFVAALRLPAIEVVYRALRQTEPCGTCGRSDSDRDPVALRAAALVLELSGIGSEHAGDASRPPPFLPWIPPDRLAVIAEWMTEARVAMQRGKPRPLPPAVPVDAVVVEQEPAADAPPAEDARLIPVGELTQ